MKQFLLVEPIAKTSYPPLGLMKISTMLKQLHPGCQVFTAIGKDVPSGLTDPEEIYITSLFTWDLDAMVDSILFYQMFYPGAEIHVGGIGATLLPGYVSQRTGIEPHIGLLDAAEACFPDYSVTFGRKLRSSITHTTRGCVRKCGFCYVSRLEPGFCPRDGWERDINPGLQEIIVLDNNFLASRNFDNDCKTLLKIGKKVDINSGLDARIYNERRAAVLHALNVDPVRFAFDDMKYADDVLAAIRLAKKYTKKEIRVYVLYNFQDSPEDFFQRINLLNKAEVWSFPMCYRAPSVENRQVPNGTWTKELLRGLKTTLMNYYNHGMISTPRKSFLKMFGGSTEEFKEKLYQTYLYDKQLNSGRCIETTDRQEVLFL